MKKLLLYCLILATVQVYGQQYIKKFVQSNYSKIRTIEPDSLDFSDLEAIGNSIGDSRIVMIGEQDHGDAPTFLAKSRLIKYLHEKKGFNILAFESDFFALNEGWSHLTKQREQINTFLRSNIFSIWSNCKQCENLFYTYISKSFETPQPLTIAGFDTQIHGAYSKNLKNYLADFLPRHKLPYTATESFRTVFLPFIDSLKISKDLEKFKKFDRQLDTLFYQLPKGLEKDFGIQLLYNLRAECKTGIIFHTKQGDTHEPRDWQMSENLKWLVNQKYQGQKIIVWAHSAHLVKNNQLIKPAYPLDNWLDMGHYFTQDSTLNQQTYVLGFTSKVGTAGRVSMPNSFRINPPVRNGFEYWIAPELKYAFVDFKKFRSLYPNNADYFNMKGRHHLNNEAVWTKVFDGVFYIRDMYPCDRID